MLSPSNAKAAAVDASLAPIQPLATQAGQNTQVVMEGWVLKKRRKKMQGVYLTRAYIHLISVETIGFARRYFILHQSGILSYSFHPGEPPRDQVLLTQAAIATAPGRKDIHIDSNTATFHIKCLSTEDFDRWMAAIRYVLVLVIPFDHSNPRVVDRILLRIQRRWGGNLRYPGPRDQLLDLVITIAPEPLSMKLESYVTLPTPYHAAPHSS